MKQTLSLIALLLISHLAFCQTSTGEFRDPNGYEIYRLSYPRSLAVQRVETYANLTEAAIGDPMFFIVNNDEATGLKDAVYLWTGIESRLISLTKTTVTKVATRAAMIALCKPGIPRRFIVTNDELESMQNTVYEWDGQYLFWNAAIYDPEKQP